MALRGQFVIAFHIIFSCLAIHASPLSPSSVQLTQLSSSIVSDISNCEPIKSTPCSRLYSSTHLPNLYGHESSKIAEQELNDALSKFSNADEAVVTFFCALYLPPCYNSSGKSEFGTPSPVPCRFVCELALEESRRFNFSNGITWPVNCQILPAENCFSSAGSSKTAIVKETIKATPTTDPTNEIITFAPLETELGNDEGYEVEVVSLSSSHIPERRYDIANLGDPDFFQGWADVQGTGAANDYCRVIGKGKRRFVSCNLAGSTGQGHHYVSKLGFEVGHPGTWFMRDMDGDGRDDYCRCVGSKNSSRLTCMKAGERGFYGSITQGGDQHTFSLPRSQGCFNKRYNPMFGEDNS